MFRINQSNTLHLKNEIWLIILSFFSIDYLNVSFVTIAYVYFSQKFYYLLRNVLCCLAVSLSYLNICVKKIVNVYNVLFMVKTKVSRQISN